MRKRWDEAEERKLEFTKKEGRLTIREHIKGVCMLGFLWKS